MKIIDTAYVAILPEVSKFATGAKAQIKGALDGVTKDVAKSATNLSTQVGKAGTDSAGFFVDAFSKVKDGVAGIIGTVATTVKGGALTLGAAAIGGLTYVLTKGFGRLTAIEDATAKLTGLGNSAATVKEIMNNALGAVRGTSFGLDEAATIAASAVAAGIKPGLELRRVLGLVADAATIGGTSLGDMGAIFNQVAASNKVQGDTIAQLNDRGIPIIQFLGKTLHKTSAEIYDMSAKGTISFDIFSKAMQTGLAGAALKSGNTTTGALKNVNAAAGRLGASLLSGLFPSIKVVFGGMIKIMDQTTAWVTANWPKIQRVIIDVWDAHVRPALVAFRDFLTTEVVPAVAAVVSWVIAHWPEIQSIFTAWWAHVKPVLEAFEKLLARIWNDIVQPFVAWVVAHWPEIQSIFTAWWAHVKPVLEAFEKLLARIWNDIVQPFVAWVKAHWSEIQDVIVGVMTVVGASFVGFTDGLALVAWVLDNVIRLLADFGKPLAVVAAVITFVLLPTIVGMAVATAISIYESVALWAMYAVEAVVNAVKAAGAFVIHNLAAIASAAVSVWAFAVMVAGWVWMGIQAMINAAKIAAAWFIALGPVGWVIAAVIALVALIIWKWDTVKKWTVAVFTFVWSFLKKHWQLILAVITGPIGLIVLLIVKNWNRIMAVTSAIWNGIKAVLQKALDALVWLVHNKTTALIAFFLWPLKLLIMAWKAWADDILRIGKDVIDWFVALPGVIGKAFASAATWLVNTGSDIINGLWSGLTTAWSTVSDWFTNLYSKVFAFFVQAPTWLLSSGKKIIVGLYNGHIAAFKFLADWFGRLPALLVGYFTAAIRWLITGGHDIVTGLWNGMKDTWVNVGTWVRGLEGAVLGFIGNGLAWLRGAGQQIVTGLWNGMKDVYNSVKNFFTSLPGNVMSWLGIHSPPAWAVNAGSWMMKGIIKGLGHGAVTLSKFVGNMAKQFGKSLLGGITGVTDSGNLAQWIGAALEQTHTSLDWFAPLMRRAMYESGGNPNAINLCVPLDTVIMTKRGWLKYSDVQVGDETIGYNRTTGTSEWTPVTAVHYYEDAPLVRMGNSRWHVTSTPNHRWLNLPRVSVPKAQRPDECPLCDWPNAPDLPTPLGSCPECGWVPKAPGGVALHRSLKHGVRGANASGNRVERFRRRGVTTERGIQIHLAKAHGLIPETQQNTYADQATWVTTDAVRSRDRLLIAAPASTPSALPITVQEAAILGWVAGDGHVEARRYGPSMSIGQVKPAMVEKIGRLLADVPHSHYVGKTDRLTRMGNKPLGPTHMFRLTPAYSRDLLSRAGHPKQDAMRQVLAMSTEQRTAWLEAIIDAEGHREPPRREGKESVSIAQCYGPILDAITAAVYLSGARPRVLDNNVDQEANPTWNRSARVAMNTPVVTGAFLAKTDAGRGPVWCVSTELGSWTAEEDGHVFLTGNSDANAKAGHPSIGLMQTIQSTFDAFKAPGVNRDIRNPVDNLVAAINYIKSKYGNIAAIDPPVSGYKEGAWNIDRDKYAMLHKGEMVVPAGPAARARSGSGGGTSQAGLVAAFTAALSGMTIRFDGDGLARLVTSAQAGQSIKGGRR